MNPLEKLEQLGQSIWLDYLSRDFIEDGSLKKSLETDSVRGVTSNPSIFEKAIGHSAEYDKQIGEILKSGETDARKIFRKLAVRDIQNACDVLRPVYDATAGHDGFVSMEVSPDLALETEKTIQEARELWSAIAKPNLMIKVPGTKEGLPAIRKLIGEGINVNITLLFARPVYEQVANAYIEGLEALPRERDLGTVASVASFFVSRIDTKIDEWIEDKLKSGSEDQAKLKSLLGKVAIASAKLAYEQYKKIFSGERWAALAKRGARPQRLLWASTGTKNKAYSDVLYIETLIGPNTVNTVPVETLDAYRDHGKPEQTLEKDVDQARQVLDDLKQVGLSIDRATDELVDEGVGKFDDAANKLYAAIRDKAAKLSGADSKAAQ
ncbi:MAG TPA: transaldolase [Rhizomicrobium sp.]|jgi:transaldolase/glucose-6-phosphate isomerase|nr:transaldolase [Rhizomicrobium sp.]